MSAITSFVWGSVSPVPFFFPVGDRNDRSKCLVFFKSREQACEVFSPRISPLGGVCAFFFVIEKTGALRRQASPRKGCVVCLQLPLLLPCDLPNSHSMPAPWANVRRGSSRPVCREAQWMGTSALSSAGWSPCWSTSLLARELLKAFRLYPSPGGDVHAWGVRKPLFP